MMLSTKGKNDTGISGTVAVIGGSIPGLQVALTLAQMGIGVRLVTSAMSLGWDNSNADKPANSSVEQRFFWPLLLRTINHPLITFYVGTQVETIEGVKGNVKVSLSQRPRYINDELCTGCGRCQNECSGKSTTLLEGRKITHTTIHKPLITAKGIPSAYVIDKNGFAPCRVSCPLGINVQGFVALLASGKTDSALALINEAAPLAGILGRVCRHPCEINCNRSKIDSPVFIRALHRYAADNATDTVMYKSKVSLKSRQERIAIIGSGPAGLTSAWELARRGYATTVFESHGVVGGMLATGIPRFRLPREVREKELEAIKDLGIDIRTGITVGRDVDFAYLRERGFKAFFLAIGAQRNNRLNIPGEELDGVVDCMSLLLTLNLMVDTFVGANIVIIGDGNSAVDSARAAIRRNKGSVKILSWTVPEELTAAGEEVEEALLEGIAIEYRTMPVEILGDGIRVTGVRCQHTELTEEIMPNGRHRPKPIEGTDFVIDADHIIVAVGQSPDAAQLNLEGLSIDKRTGVIKIDPLTLETNIPGVFAGGDCITGPNNVVEAMAAGIRAAESIDRYIQKHDLKKERSLEPPKTAEIDSAAMEISPHKRASMPTIRLQKRLNTLEETTTGLSPETALRESQRCLKCALCSHCMECARVCELGAVFHEDKLRHLEIEATSVIEFADNPSDAGYYILEKDNSRDINIETIKVVSFEKNAGLASRLEKAMAVALKTGLEIISTNAIDERVSTKSLETVPTPDRQMASSTGSTENIGVFLCSCGSSLSSIIDFKTMSKKLLGLHEVTSVYEIPQACTEAGAKQIAGYMSEHKLGRIVLAACRCCGLEQVCFSCTDRRMMYQQFLGQYLDSSLNSIVEFVNIREHCAWVHKNDPRGATRKAIQMVSAGVKCVSLAPSLVKERRKIVASALVVGGGTTSITMATAIANYGYQVTIIIPRHDVKPHKQGVDGATKPILEELQRKGIAIKPWPDSMELYGSPGNYKVLLKNGSQTEHLTTGAILADVTELTSLSAPASDELLSRILSRTHDFINDLLHEITIKETVGVFLVSSGSDSTEDDVLHGLATAAQALSFLSQRELSSQTWAVDIDKRLCRGCGNCAAICSYIVMENEGGNVSASVNQSLCIGCGVCVSSCPTGAIGQAFQDDKQIISTIYSMLH